MAADTQDVRSMLVLTGQVNKLSHAANEWDYSGGELFSEDLQSSPREQHLVAAAVAGCHAGNHLKADNRVNYQANLI